MGESEKEAVEFVIEPAGQREILIRVTLSCVVPGLALAVLIAALNQVVLYPLMMLGAFTAMGCARALFWVWRFRENGFKVNESEVVATSLKKRWEIPLEEVCGIRFLDPAQGPEYQYGGFQKIELELVGGKKVKHKVAIFKRGCAEKSKELDGVAPMLGFEQGARGFWDTGFWRK